MLNTLKELSKYLDELDKGEVNTPVRLRSILKSVDSINVSAYVHSFSMNIFNQLFKSNNIYGERFCREFIQSEIWKFNYLKQNGIISFPDLQLLTKKCLFEYVGKRLESYTEEEENFIKDVHYPLYRIHYKAIANKRNKQEDRYFGVTNILNYACNHYCNRKNSCNINNQINNNNILFVGLFDGHNGPEAAEHCHHLAPYFVSNYLQTSLCSKGQYNVIEALGETFHSLNNTLNGCRNKYRWKSGTTATMCLIDHNFVYTGWVGDCSAWMIYTDNSQVPLTDILHRPSQTSEVVDVWNNGGIVTKSGSSDYDRVNGILAVTRALGDDRKIVGVSPLPSLSELRHKGTELCIVLATDGLWDSRNCSGSEIGSLCRDTLLQNGHFNDDQSISDNLCQLIIDRAVRGGASDNISVILITMFPSSVTLHDDNDNNNSNNVQDSRQVRWPRQRRRSCFPEEMERLRRCPPYLDNYLQAHFCHNIKMHGLLQQTKDIRVRESSTSSSRRRRAKSLSSSQDIDKRFSSPLRSIGRP